MINFKNTVVRPTTVLTNAYVAGTILEGCQKFNTLTLNIDLTKGSLTDAQIKVEVSSDGVNYYQLLSDSIVSGVNTPALLLYKFAPTTTFIGSTTPLSLNASYIKISAIGTGTVTGSLLSVEAVLSSN